MSTSRTDWAAEGPGHSRVGPRFPWLRNALGALLFLLCLSLVLHLAALVAEGGGL